MSRLSKWYAELKRLQDVHEIHCAGIYTYEGVPSFMPDHLCEPDCANCMLEKTTFDNWFEETFK